MLAHLVQLDGRSDTNPGRKDLRRRLQGKQDLIRYGKRDPTHLVAENTILPDTLTSALIRCHQATACSSARLRLEPRPTWSPSGGGLLEELQGLDGTAFPLEGPG